MIAVVKLYTYHGKTLSAAEWAAELGISRDAFYQRVDDINDENEIFKSGFLRKPVRKNQFHGCSGTATYNSWADMIKRCTNPKNRKWPRYGGRGIKISRRWMKFENFLADMGERPVGTTIDRIDNDKNYSKDNCRWATPKQQGNNTSTNWYVDFEGQRMTVQQAADKLGIKGATLRARLRRQKRSFVTKKDAGLLIRADGVVRWIGADF